MPTLVTRHAAPPSDRPARMIGDAHVETTSAVGQKPNWAAVALASVGIAFGLSSCSDNRKDPDYSRLVPEANLRAVFDHPNESVGQEVSVTGEVRFVEASPFTTTTRVYNGVSAGPITTSSFYDRITTTEVNWYFSHTWEGFDLKLRAENMVLPEGRSKVLGRIDIGEDGKPYLQVESYFKLNR